MSDRDPKAKAPSAFLAMDTELLRELLKLGISWADQETILGIVQERAMARYVVRLALEPRNDHRRPKR